MTELFLMWQVQAKTLYFKQQNSSTDLKLCTPQHLQDQNVYG